MFTQNKEDRKRVEKALDISGFPSGKVSFVLTIVNIILERKFAPKYFVYIIYDNFVS